MAKREFTAVYQKRNTGYIAWVEEIPGANSQGRTKKEVKANLREALSLVLSANREIAQKHSAANTERESIRIAVPA